MTEREKRLITIGVVATVAILAFTYGADGVNHWSRVRVSLKEAKAKLSDVTIDETKRAGLLSIVPAFEAPQLEEKQKFLFRDKLSEQLKKAGVKTEPLQILPIRKKANSPYDVLKIKCSGKCQFDQLLDFLASLKENPYLVGVEELRVRCDPKQPPDKRKEVEIDLTVSTFVKKVSRTPKTGAAVK